MYGAIIGDIVGSPYEFDQGKKTKDFPLFDDGCGYTDDTVMTIAVAKALLASGLDADAEIMKQELIVQMHKWGHKYPYAGYGMRFGEWIDAGDTKPYGSWGNGSAMRVSAVGWLYDSLERTREVARITAEVTHNHPEGIKGAESTAAIMFLARNGATKQEIKAYVTREFGYDLSRSLDEIRPTYHHTESCMETLPEAITAFLEGNSYEDVIRGAVSIGGDTDTLAAIAGAMAEAFYKVPSELKRRAEEFLEEDMLDVLDAFTQVKKKKVIKETIQ